MEEYYFYRAHDSNFNRKSSIQQNCKMSEKNFKFKTWKKTTQTNEPPVEVVEEGVPTFTYETPQVEWSAATIEGWTPSVGTQRPQAARNKADSGRDSTLQVVTMRTAYGTFNRPDIALDKFFGFTFYNAFCAVPNTSGPPGVRCRSNYIFPNFCKSKVTMIKQLYCFWYRHSRKKPDLRNLTLGAMFWPKMTSQLHVLENFLTDHKTIL